MPIKFTVDDTLFLPIIFKIKNFETNKRRKLLHVTRIRKIAWRYMLRMKSDERNTLYTPSYNVQLSMLGDTIYIKYNDSVTFFREYYYVLVNHLASMGLSVCSALVK